MSSNTTPADQVEIGAAAAAAAAAAGPAWRQFSFFEPTHVRDANDFARSPAAFSNANQVAAVATCPVRPPPKPATSAINDPPALQLGLPAPTTPGPSSRSALRANLREPSVLLGTIDGHVHVLHPDTYDQLASWVAFPAGRITHMSCDSRGRVITLGEQDSSRFPVLRIWDMRVPNGKQSQTHLPWTPKLLSEGKVQHGSRPHPIAALSHTPSLSFLSVALADGTVLLIRGLDTTLMSASASTAANQPSTSQTPMPAVALPKFKVVYQPSTQQGAAHEPVTALGFSEAPAPPSLHPSANGAPSRDAPAQQQAHPARGRKPIGPAPRQRAPKHGPAAAAAAAKADQNPSASSDAAPSSVHLFIVTLSRILRYIVVGKGAGGSPAVLDDVGCALGCAAIIPSKPNARPTPGSSATILGGKMVVAREEAIYVIGPDGREACFAYEGPKSSIHLSASQVIIVSPPFLPSASSASATVRNFVASRDSQSSAFTPSSSASRGSPLTSAGGLSSRRRVTQTEIAKVTVFDLDNKLVAYSGTFENGVREAWVGPSGEVLVLNHSGNLIRLDEKPLRSKLEILYKKSLFLLAVNLARSHAERAGTPDALARIESLMADIYQRYGDHLYNKGDFEGAMAQYVKTIGHTQPSFVIRKFLDAQRITNLTTYLQELHARGMASSDHTTLLLNCYTKLKDVASLDKFIMRPPTITQAQRPASPGGDGDHQDEAVDGNERDELPFDLETAMRVCRQAGYYGHAAYLAKRYAEHDEYIKIQIEDAADFQDALNYVESLEPEEAIRKMNQYGKVLLAELPDETTDLLIQLCSGAFQPVQEQNSTAAVAAAAANGSVGKSAAAAYLSYLQVGAFSSGGAAAGAASGRTGVTGGAASAGANTGNATPNYVSNRNSSATIEPYHVDGSKRNSALPGADADTSALKEDEEDKMEAYPPPSPRVFFAHFIQHPTHFIRFLETVALARWGQTVNMDVHAPSHNPLSLESAVEDNTGGDDQDDLDSEVAQALRELGLPADSAYENQDISDQKSIWNTLLELYLASSKAGADSFGLDGAQRAHRRERALHLLEQHDALPYDVSHALMLCSMEGFTEGLVLLYERMGMYEDVLRFWMDAEDGGAEHDEPPSCKVITALNKYGHVRPHLYPIVLRYLASSEAILSRHTADLMGVLDHIEAQGLMSALEVVQALSRAGVASVGLVRDYLARSIKRERDDTARDMVEIEQYRHETQAKLVEVAQLTDAEQPRVFQMTRCSACGGQLDLPSVHFMCKHSYHQRCLGENETECPSCARSHGVIRDLRRNHELLADRHDLFISEIQESHDGFAAIANMYSKGLMGLATSAQTQV